MVSKISHRVSSFGVGINGFPEPLYITGAYLMDSGKIKGKADLSII